MRTAAHVALASLALFAFADRATAQCQLLVRESFRLGPRPHGGNGRLRDVFVHDTLGGYHPQVPAPAQWITTNQSGAPTWAFAGSSIDPLEADPLDENNGTAFGEPPATALLPFQPPAGPFTLSAEGVVPFGLDGALCIGFTSSAETASNLATHGALWVSWDGLGRWRVLINGSNVVAEGLSYYGAFESGWGHLDLTFDPATATVRGRIGGSELPPTPAPVTRPMAYLCMEVDRYWAVVNNLSVFTGSPPSPTIQVVADACDGAPAEYRAATPAAEPLVFMWRRNGLRLHDGTLPGGSVVTGSATPTLHILSPSPADAGVIDAVVAGECAYGVSDPVTYAPGQCPVPCDPDMNRDGNADQDDVAYLINVIGGGTNPTGIDPDFTQDGNADQDDVIALINTVGGGGCP